MESAAAALAIDPRNLDVRERLAKWKLQAGATVEGLELYKSVLRERPSNTDALNAVGLNALAIGDETLFRAVMNRLASAPKGTVMVHEPDLVLARGSIDNGAIQLIDLEPSDPNNKSLALKIGRFAVLRRMMTVADIEVKKLQVLSPDYGYHILNAYILAERGQGGEATAALNRAQVSAAWHEQPYTASAEVYAMLGNSRGVLDSLEVAVKNGEPTGTYVLNNPLFRYLRTDARFRRIEASIQARQLAIRNALADVRI